MSNFKSNTVELGEVPERKTITAKFEVISDKQIIKVEPSCGCTPSTFNLNSVTIRYRTGNIPLHLKDTGKAVIDKHAEVFFNDGSTEKVYMKAILRI